jgi:hypothetical protein
VPRGLPLTSISCLYEKGTNQSRAARAQAAVSSGRVQESGTRTTAAKLEAVQFILPCCQDIFLQSGPAVIDEQSEPRRNNGIRI